MIEVRDLTKRYGPTLAVDALSFGVRPGVVTGFLGPEVVSQLVRASRHTDGLATLTPGSATCSP
jgi:ABC-2 type transport system ATP-binding protein